MLPLTATVAVRSVPDAAAIFVGGVAGQDAAADRQRAIVVDAAAVACDVGGQGAAADRQRAVVVDAAAFVARCWPDRVQLLTVSVPKLTMPPPRGRG